MRVIPKPKVLDRRQVIKDHLPEFQTKSCDLTLDRFL